MSMYENNYKSGHPVLGIVLGLLGIAAALTLTLLGGAIGGAIALLLGLIALLLGLKARKGSGKGFGAILTGVLAIILAVAVTISVVGLFRSLHESAQGMDDAPLVAKFLDKPYLGFIGLALNTPDDEGSANELISQMNLVISRLGAEAETGAPEATEASAADAAETEAAEAPAADEASGTDGATE